MILQCVPLLGAVSCVASGASNQSLRLLPLLLWWSVLAFGLGYERIGRRRRWILAAITGPAIALGTCTASFVGVSYDFEHCHNGGASISGYSCGGLTDADRASIQTGLVVGAITLLLAVDVWRLAAQQAAVAPADSSRSGEF